MKYLIFQGILFMNNFPMSFQLQVCLLAIQVPDVNRDGEQISEVCQQGPHTEGVSPRDREVEEGHIGGGVTSRLDSHAFIQTGL